PTVQQCYQLHYSREKAALQQRNVSEAMSYMWTTLSAVKCWPDQAFLFPSVQPTVLRQITLLLGPDISGRLCLAKEPSKMRRERNCPVSLSPLSVHPLRPAFRPGLLIVSLGEVVAAQWWGGG
ncbi:hypothetical protein KUCAC02_007208, partial [Chaenocephalus aceratus]